MKHMLIGACALCCVGCSSLSGSQHYSCPYTNQGQCQSVSETYHKAIQSKHTSQAIPPSANPMLTQPTVLRVLYAPSYTIDDDYDAGGYMYLKIEEARWQH